MKRFPDKKEYVYDMAEIEYSNKKYKRVIKLLERPKINQEINARMSFILAKAYLETSQRNKLDVLVKKITREFPDEAKTSIEMAMVYYDKKLKSRAKDILSRLNRKEPTEVSHYYAGKLAFEEEDWNGSVVHFLKAGNYARDVNLYLGKGYLNVNKKTEAVKYLEKYSIEFPAADVLQLIYPLYLDIKDTSWAVKTLERLIKMKPNSDNERIQLAELYNSTGQETKSQKMFSSILKKNPGHPGANLMMGKLRAQNRKYKTAIKMLKKGLQVHPNDWEAWEILGTCYLQLKDYKRALEAYSKSFKINDSNITAAVKKLETIKALKLSESLTDAHQDVIRLDSNNAESASFLGNMHYDKGELSKAARMYRLAVKQIKDDSLIWKNYSLALVKTHQSEKAKGALEQAVKLKVKDPEVLVRLGEIYVKDKQYKPAENILLPVLKKYPSRHFAMFLLGEVFYKTKRLEDAEKYFENALKKNPSSTIYYENLARVYLDLKKFDDCITTLLKVKSSLSNDGKLMLTKCYTRKEMYPEAVKYAKAVYKDSPSEKLVLIIADLFLQANSPEKAIEIIQKSKYTQSKEVKTALGKSFSKAGQFLEAHNIVSELQSADPSSPKNFYLKALIHYDENEFKKSVKELKSASQNNGEMPEIPYLKGKVLLRLKKFKQAAGNFRVLTKSENPAWKAKGHLGLAFIKKYDSDYNGMLQELGASYTSDFNTESAYHLIKTLIHLKKLPEAEDILKSAQSINKEHPRVVAAHAEILLAEDNKAQAYQVLKRKLESFPNSCELLITLTKVHLIKGNYEKVRARGKQTLEACPDMIEAHLYLGNVNYKVFDKKKAKKNFRDYIKNGGDKKMLPAEY